MLYFWAESFLVPSANFEVEKLLTGYLGEYRNLILKPTNTYITLPSVADDDDDIL